MLIESIEVVVLVVIIAVHIKLKVNLQNSNGVISKLN